MSSLPEPSPSASRALRRADSAMRCGRRSQNGYALLIMIIVLVAGSLYTVVSQLEVASRKYQRAGSTMGVLAEAKEALLAYALTYRDGHANDVFGYLPCPDTATKTGFEVPGDGNAASTCGNAGEVAVGLLPYKTLGLPDLRDSDGVCLWYAISGRYKNSPQGTSYNSVTNPTPQPLNWDTQGQFAIYGTSVAPDSGDGGAAAVIFAAGAPLSSQNRSSGGSAPCNISPAQVAAYLDGGYNFSGTATITLTPGPIKDAAGNTTNNDLLAWFTPREIFDRVVKRPDFGNVLTATPAGQINTWLNETRAVLDKRIQDDILAGGTPSSGSKPVNIVASTPYYVGSIQPTDIAGTQNPDRLGDKSVPLYSTLPPSYVAYIDNWAENARQATCTSLDTPCLDIDNGGTANCRGALFFGGRRTDGLPRPSTEKTINASCDWQCVLGKYFETSGALNLLRSGSGSFVGNLAYDNTSATTRAGDVAACLGQGTFVSLQRNADLFNQGTVRVGGGANPVASVTGIGTASPTITLGSSTASSSAGCVWYPTSLPLGSSLRIYFSYNIASAASTARGFALAIADAAANNPAYTNPPMCGASGSTRMGYAGAPTTGMATVGASTLGIAALSWSPSTGLATVTTASAHGFFSGSPVTVSGAYPNGYNGSYTISSVPSSTTFRYAIPNPGLPQAGIVPPKLGVEFDTNPETAASQRNDPSAEHFAQLFWGSIGDNNPVSANSIRDGGDDNTHGNGIVGDGSQPRNPRSLSLTAATATPVATVAAAQWAGGVATIDTAGAHGLAVGNRFVVADASTLGYKGSATVATTPSATQFTYALASDPGPYPRIAAVASATWSLGTATITTRAAHGLSNGQGIVLGNATPSAWNGSYTITTLDATRFTISIASNPGTYQSGALVLNPVATVSGAACCGTSAVAVAAASWASNTATITTAFAHGLTTGQYVTLASLSPTAWNGSYPVKVLSATQFSFTRTTDPGAYTSGGTVTASGSATITTSAAHGLVSGQYVTLAGIAPAGYNGTYQITVSDTTHFTYVPLTNPGTYTSGGRVAVAPMTSTVMAGTSTAITNATWSTAGTVTITSASHGLTTGQTVYISGMNPSAYNGVYVATVTSTSQFTYSRLTDPGAFVAGGAVAVAAPASRTLASATWSSANGGTASITTSAAHGLATGQIVNIDSVSPPGFNGAYAVTVTGATTFTYALAADPGGSFSATTFDTPGIASVKTADVFLPYSAMPLTTDIHVRVDIVRGYDNTRRQATVSLKAYVGDTFDISGNCLLSDFKNLALDIAKLCPTRTPTLAQNGITINDLAGPALANVFLGFTTARGVSSNDNQSVQIKNLILRSQ